MRTREHAPVEPEVERIATLIVDSAFSVHKALGPGLLESVYEPCFCRELEKRSVPYKRQVHVPLVYDGVVFREALRLDVLVGGWIVCELISIEQALPVHVSQVLTYLKLTRNRLGFLINFNVPVNKHGIRRIIL